MGRGSPDGVNEWWIMVQQVQQARPVEHDGGTFIDPPGRQSWAEVTVRSSEMQMDGPRLDELDTDGCTWMESEHPETTGADGTASSTWRRRPPKRSARGRGLMVPVSATRQGRHPPGERPRAVYRAYYHNNIVI